MLPAPIVFPNAHVPVAGAEMVVLLLGWDEEVVLDLTLSAATPLICIAEVVDASDA